VRLDFQISHSLKSSSTLNQSVFSNDDAQNFKKFQYNFASFYNIIRKQPPDLLDNLLTDLHNKKLETDIPSFLLVAIDDLIKVITLTKNISNSIYQKDEYPVWLPDALRCAKNDILSLFFDEFYGDPVNFFNYFDEYLKEYAFIKQREIEYETQKELRENNDLNNCNR
jgi:hypothetical protein